MEKKNIFYEKTIANKINIALKIKGANFNSANAEIYYKNNLIGNVITHPLHREFRIVDYTAWNKLRKQLKEIKFTIGDRYFRYSIDLAIDEMLADFFIKKKISLKPNKALFIKDKINILQYEIPKQLQDKQLKNNGYVIND